MFAKIQVQGDLKQQKSTYTTWHIPTSIVDRNLIEKTAESEHFHVAETHRLTDRLVVHNQAGLLPPTDSKCLLLWRDSAESITPQLKISQMFPSQNEN